MPLRYSAAASNSGALELGVELGEDPLARLAEGRKATNPINAVRAASARFACI